MHQPQIYTVSESLKQSENKWQKLYLLDIVMVMDQALYAKTAEIIWKQADQYANLILRLDIFHTIWNVMSIHCTRFKDVGIRDLCNEAGIIA